MQNVTAASLIFDLIVFSKRLMIEIQRRFIIPLFVFELGELEQLVGDDIRDSGIDVDRQCLLVVLRGEGVVILFVIKSTDVIHYSSDADLISQLRVNLQAPL